MMLKERDKILTSVLVVTILNLIAGCYHFQSISVSEYEKIENEDGQPEEIYVKTKEVEWYHLKDYQYKIISDTLYGIGSKLSDEWQEAEYIKIALSNIESIGVEDMNYVTTGLVWFIAIGGVIVSILAIWWLFSEKEINPK